MDITRANVLITGANRGIGRATAEALLAAGARTVYAAARDASTVTTDGVVPVELDITDPAQVAAAAERCADVDVVINNAGYMSRTSPLRSPSLEDMRREVETNVFGTLAVCRAFAPVLARNGGGVLVNQLSVVSWYSPVASGTYSASKAAEWSLTNVLRTELRAQGTRVVGVHCGYVDTDMVSDVSAPKITAADLAAQIVEGIRSGAEEVLADDFTREVKAALPHDLQVLYPRD